LLHWLTGDRRPCNVQSIKEYKTRISAVAVIVDRTAYDVPYIVTDRWLKIAVVSMGIYLFTVSNGSLLLMPEIYC